jgi:divalent metal cation (Fe/Co/Zn/Cd) transporter
VVEKVRINNAKPINIQVLRLSLIAIVSVVIFEFCAGVIANSLSLITDSAHALLDAGVTGILLIAARLALKPRDIEHTYGHRNHRWFYWRCGIIRVSNIFYL